MGDRFYCLFATAIEVSKPKAHNASVIRCNRSFDAHFDEIKGRWEERFERRFGFGRGFVDE